MMTFQRIAFAALAALSVFSASSAGAATVASENRRFNAIVASAVANLNNELVNDMTRSERRAWNSCVQQVYSSVPQGRKRYVLAGSSRSEQLKRLEEVSYDDQAAVRKQIGQQC